MDLATALDLNLEEQQEAKFMALRTLHGKKIKQLMLSIETKEKEVAKLKLLGKDSRRTQMIQALRNKIKDMELTMDVMKEEIGKVRENPRSKEEVNDFVIRKTVGGPKRFRPQTREEMENRILELEKKAQRGGGRGGGSVSGGPSIASQARSIAGARDALTSIAGRQGIKLGGIGEGRGGPESDTMKRDDSTSLSKIAQLMEEINGLRSALDVSEGNCELQKEEVARLRKRNSDLAAEAEEVGYYKTQCNEVENSKEDALEEMVLVQRKLAEVVEENSILKTNSNTELEMANAELDALQTHCEKLLNQNASLLKKLGDLEEELDDAHHQSGLASVMSRQAVTGSAQSAQMAAETEKKMIRLQDKLKQSELLIASLQADNQQIMQLKSQMREKNNVIKTQSKKLSEFSSSRENSRSPMRSGTNTGTAESMAGLGGVLGSPDPSSGGPPPAEVIAQLKAKLKDTEAENERLGNALTAATRRLNSPDRRAPDGGSSASAAVTAAGRDGPVSPRDKDLSKIKGLQLKLAEAEQEIEHLHGVIASSKADHDSFVRASDEEKEMLKSALADADEAIQSAEQELADTSKALRKEKKRSAALAQEQPGAGRGKGDEDDEAAFYAIQEVTQAILETYRTLLDHYTAVMETGLSDGKVRKIVSKAPLPLSFVGDVEAAISKIVNQKSPDPEDKEYHDLNLSCEKGFVALRELLGEIQGADGSADVMPGSSGGRGSPLTSPLVNSRPGSRKGSPRS